MTVEDRYNKCTTELRPKEFSAHHDRTLTSDRPGRKSEFANNNGAAMHRDSRSHRQLTRSGSHVVASSFKYTHTHTLTIINRAETNADQHLGNVHTCTDQKQLTYVFEAGGNFPFKIVSCLKRKHRVC